MLNYFESCAIIACAGAWLIVACSLMTIVDEWWAIVVGFFMAVMFVAAWPYLIGTARAAETVNPVSTPTPRTVYLAPDGTVLTSAAGANRKLTAQGNAAVGTPTWLVPTATATPKEK